MNEVLSDISEYTIVSMYVSKYMWGERNQSRADKFFQIKPLA